MKRQHIELVVWTFCIFWFFMNSRGILPLKENRKWITYQFESQVLQILHGWQEFERNCGLLIAVLTIWILLNILRRLIWGIGREWVHFFRGSIPDDQIIVFIILYSTTVLLILFY